MAESIVHSRGTGRGRRPHALAGLLLAAMLPAAAACAQSVVQITVPQFPLTQVSQSATQNATITVLSGGNQVVFNSIQLGPGQTDYTLGPITGCVVDGTTPNTDGTVCTVPITFTPTLPGNASAPQPIARTAALQINDVENGNPQGYSLGILGSGARPLAVLVPGIISDPVGNDQTPTSGYAGDNSFSPSTAVFNQPFNMAVDNLGDIYISDTGNCVVRRIDKVTGLVTTVAGIDPSPAPNCGPGIDNTGALSSPLNGNWGIALDAAGNLYIADSANGAVREVNAITGIISTVAGMLNNPGYGGDGGPANQAQLFDPSGIAVDGYGNLYIADTANWAVREVSAATGVINTIAGEPTQEGNPSTETAGVAATSFQLGAPQAVTVDSAGNVYIDDTFYSGVLEVAPATGLISAVPLPLPPSSLAVDASDALYFTVNGACGVYKLPAGTTTPMTVAGNGSCTPSGDGGLATLAGLNHPNDVVVDGSGGIYILESDGVRFVQSFFDVATEPVISYIPVPFGPTQIGTTATQNVVIFNGDVQQALLGEYPFVGVSLEGGIEAPNPPFADGFTDCNPVASIAVTIYPGTHCTLAFTFSPLTDGPFNATTGIFEPPLLYGFIPPIVQLFSLTGTGTGTGPTATLLPAVLNLSTGSNFGTTSGTVYLTNTSSAAPLAISSVSLSGVTPFGITSNTCPSTLAAGAQCSITVSFTPTSVGLVSQMLTVTDAAGSQTVTINGTGTAATATLTPPSASFTGVVKETSTSLVPFTLTNTSTTAGMSISGIAFAQFNGYYLASNTCSTVLPPTQSCTISVGYEPATLAATTNTLQVYSDATPSPLTASLSGTSTAPTAMLSGSVIFPSTAVGATSSNQSITLTNTGNATLHISSIAYAGDYPGDFTVSSGTCGSTLAPAASCNITVTFSPQGPGNYTGSVAVTDDSGGQSAGQFVTQTASVTGLSPFITLASSFTAGNTAFPSTPVGGVGETENVTLTLNSPSTIINSIAIAPGYTEWIVDSVSGCTVDGTTANPAGTVCTIAVTFIPSTVGSMHNAPLVVTTLESGVLVPYYFGLTALSTGPVAALTPGIIGPYVAADGSFGGANPLSGLGGQATTASVGFFNGMVIDSGKNMYVSDSYYDVIYKINASGVISLYAGTPFSPGGYLQDLSGDGGPAINATIAYGGPLALDTAGNLYLGDTDSFGDERIRVISAATGTITTVVGGGSGCSAQTDTFGDGCTGTQAVLSTGVGGSVTGLAFDSAGNLYFTATSAYTSGSTASIVNYAIRKWNPSTGIVSLVAGAVGQTPGSGADGGPAVGAQIAPSSMAFDSNGNLLVIDNGVKVRQISPTGTITTIAGNTNTAGPLPESGGILPCTNQFYSSATSHSAGNGGPATSATFCDLTGIAVDAANNIYLNDYSASEVRRIDAATGTIVEVSGANSTQNLDFGDYNEALGNNDGSARDASLRYPESIALDASANIYIMEAEGEVRWINVSQSALDYTPYINPNPPYNRDAVNIGTLTGPQQVTVVNAGNSGSVTFNGPFTAPPLFGINTADYTRDTAAADCIATTAGIAPGTECPINIDFTPTTAGSPIQDTETVNDNAGTQTINLIGYASGTAQLSLLPALQLFEGSVNTVLGPQTFTLTNNSSYVLNLTAITITGPNAANFSASNNCGAALAISSSCTISVTFQAATLGQFLGQVNVAYTQDYGNGPYPGSLTANLLGLTGSPEGAFVLDKVAANPAIFANVQVGATATHTLQFASTGTTALSISSVTITGTNASQFIIASNNCPALLQPSATCSIAVTFTPSANASYSAQLTVNDNAADSPQTATLSGTGSGYLLSINETIHVTDAPSLTPSTVLQINETIHVGDAIASPSFNSQATLSPASLSFANVTVGNTSTAQAVTLSNPAGGGTLTIASVTVPSGYTIAANTCGTSLAAGSSCTITVTFNPAGTGSDNGLLTVTDSAGNSPQTAALTGTGVTQNVLTVTANNLSRTFGTANPTLSYSVTGFVNNDTIAVLSGQPALSTTATLNSPPGAYPITISAGSLSAPSNYVINFLPGILRVNGGAAQTITFLTLPPSISLSFGQLSLAAHSTSGLPISYTVSGPATLSGNTLSLTGAGTVIVTAAQAGNSSFAAASSVAQSFTVTTP